MKRSLLSALAAFVLALGLTASASAQDVAATAEKAAISATLGFGVSMDDGDFNPYGLGLGVRGGYTLDMNLYVGGFFNFFLGESSSASGLEATARIMPLAAEVGYDLAVGDLVIRPSVGIGLAIAMSSVSGSIAGMSVDDSNTETRLLIAPGANVIYPIDNLFIGAEVRYYMIPTEDTGDAFLLAANVGTMF